MPILFILCALDALKDLRAEIEDWLSDEPGARIIEDGEANGVGYLIVRTRHDFSHFTGDPDIFRFVCYDPHGDDHAEQ